MLTEDRAVDADAAMLRSWLAYAFWTFACAWPAAAFPPVAPWVHYVLAAAYGGLAVLWRSPVAAGTAAACVGCLALRDASLAHGPVIGVAGAFVAGALAVGMVDASIDDLARDGRAPARAACLDLLVGGLLAAVWTVPLADLLALAVRAVP